MIFLLIILKATLPVIANRHLPFFNSKRGPWFANSITVDWGAVSGLYPNAVEVIESNAAGCPGNPILIDVYVLDLSGNAIGPFCPGDPSMLLTGNPLGGTWSGTGVVGGNFDPATAGVGNYVLTYSMAGCNTTINVVVNNGPVTGPIQHF